MCINRAILSENEFMNRQNSASDPYDQYELSVPLQSAGDCLAKARAALVAHTHLVHIIHRRYMRKRLQVAVVFQKCMREVGIVSWWQGCLN